MAQVPSGSRAEIYEKRFNVLFPSDPYSRIDSFIVAPRPNGTDIIDTAHLTQVFSLLQAVLNLTVSGTASDAAPLVGYTEFCSTPIRGAGCLIYSPLGYWNNNLTYMQSRSPTELHADVNTLLLSGAAESTDLSCITSSAQLLLQILQEDSPIVVTMVVADLQKSSTLLRPCAISSLFLRMWQAAFQLSSAKCWAALSVPFRLMARGTQLFPLRAP